MGFNVYICTEVEHTVVPEKYLKYDEGIKGNWLLPYRTFINISNDEDMSTCEVDKYLTNYFPTWETVAAHIEQEYPDDLTIWTRDEHDEFREALEFYKSRNDKYIIVFTS